MSKALDLLQEIKENVEVCCAITMEPDEVLLKIEELEMILKQYDDEPTNTLPEQKGRIYERNPDTGTIRSRRIGDYGNERYED